MKLQDIHNVYFIGVGGIGMSAIARYFHRLGKNVAGYDKTPTHLTNELIAEGISIHFTDDVNAIDPKYTNKETTLVVITPAIPIDHSEWNYFKKNNFVIKKRAEVLGIITENTYSFAVAGTHGKTTTSSMLAHIMYANKTDVTSFLGGVLENYQTNLVGDGKTLTVVEADEFDRSFLHLHPNIACVISTDADHLDIYGTEDEIKSTFKEFSQKIEDKNLLFVAEHTGLEGVQVGFDPKCDIHIHNVRVVQSKVAFDIKYNTQLIQGIEILMPGNHNILNATLALAMAMAYGVDIDGIKKALASFTGVRRRFSYKVKNDRYIYIDDYAHHPTEINAVSQAVHQMYPDKKILAIFQPHLFSRTKDFMEGFAQSLSSFSEIVLLDIYPARELPIEGVNSQVLLDQIENSNKCLINKEDLLTFIQQKEFDVLVTIGAGDIGEMVDDITTIIENK